MLDPHFIPSRNWEEFSVPSFLVQDATAPRGEQGWPSLHIQLPVTLVVRASCGAARSVPDPSTG